MNVETPSSVKDRSPGNDKEVVWFGDVVLCTACRKALIRMDWTALKTRRGLWRR